jgi:hypothetical protein
MEEKLGDYIYMGMGKCKEQTVCMSVAYKIDYCIKKAKQFEELVGGEVRFYKINKVKVGELTAKESFNTEGERNE